MKQIYKIIESKAYFKSIPSDTYLEGWTETKPENWDNIFHSNEIRKIRDKLLKETDWWASSDLTMSSEQIAYRQALRDIPQQENFPTDINWPSSP